MEILCCNSEQKTGLKLVIKYQRCGLKNNNNKFTFKFKQKIT